MQPKPPLVQEDDGYERGRAEGYASALAEFERRIEQEKQALAAQAAEERQQLLNETAAKLAGDIAEMGDQLQGRIAGVAARLLEPLISNAVQKQAVTAFIEHLSSITTDSRRPVLRITGPSDLLRIDPQQARRPRHCIGSCVPAPKQKRRLSSIRSCLRLSSRYGPSA